MIRVISILLLCSLLLTSSYEQIAYAGIDDAVADIVDWEQLTSCGDDWVVLSRDTSQSQGHVRLGHDKWLMYFLHWRPLTPEREDISVEYVRDLMLSFWGPQMPFTLNGQSGEMEVAGHKAYFVEGTLERVPIKTIFIVWNCQQTGRQFISDCNINKRKGTQDDLLNLQIDITRSISCHGQPHTVDDSLLRQKYSSDPYNLAFFIPESWHTDEFNNPDWFPEGMSDENGSLWTLLTDSEKYVELRWIPAGKGVSTELFYSFIEEMQDTFMITAGTRITLSNFEIERMDVEVGRLKGSGSFRRTVEIDEKIQQISFVFEAFLWEDERIYFLLASIISLEEWWQMPNDLSPSKDTIVRFIEDMAESIRPFSKVRFGE